MIMLMFFAASLLMLLYNFFSQIISSIIIISFYVLSKRIFLKSEGLSDARVASITKKEYGFAVHFLKRFMKTLKSISDK